ncbi:MAG: hypothetical protein JNM29_04845 [Candidatus Odyssella sp.]|nr:hypothetical protein [Candidatus Odyssella sp.]
MRTALFALAAACGLVFATAGTGFAQDRAATARSGKVEDKVKRSLPRRAERTPDVHGGTLAAEKNPIVYF